LLQFRLLWLCKLRQNQILALSKKKIFFLKSKNLFSILNKNTCFDCKFVLIISIASLNESAFDAKSEKIVSPIGVILAPKLDCFN
jgi:hypothetical protein